MVRIPENRSVPELVFFITTGLRNRRPLFRRPKVAQLVMECFQFFRNRGEIELYGYVIMPDHLHVILKPKSPVTVSQIVKRFKTYVAHAVGQGRIWEKGYWSEVIEGDYFLRQKLVYIHENPVRAGLVQVAQDYEWSSAREYLCKMSSEIVDPY